MPRYPRAASPLAVARDTALPIALLTLTLALGGCASLIQGLDPATRGDAAIDVVSAERRGEHAFAAYGIPVAELTTDRRVRSGTFMASEVWDQGSIEDKVFCGWADDGTPRVRGRDVELELVLRLSPRQGYTRVNLDSSGRIREAVGEPGAKCRLASEFSRELVGVVAGELPGGGRRWPVASAPWESVRTRSPRVADGPMDR